jgi:two-component system chemotaxis response regulator CheY
LLLGSLEKPLTADVLYRSRGPSGMRSKGDFPSMNEKDPEGLKEDGSSYRVLVCDDSMFVAKQLHQILTSAGFEVVGTATDGEDAVEKYKELHPNVDLITMDITMPKLDGVTALQRIIDFDKDAVVVMISALGKNDLVKNSLLIGAKNYIVKPLDRKKVLERIVQTLKQ